MNSERTDFEIFLNKNKIKKKDIAEYLGVSAAFITLLCSGARPIPNDKFDLIKSNLAWDISMFPNQGDSLKKAGLQENNSGQPTDDFQRSLLSAMTAVKEIAESNRILAESNHDLTKTNQILATSNTDLVEKLAGLLEEIRDMRTMGVYPTLTDSPQTASDVKGHYIKDKR